MRWIGLAVPCLAAGLVIGCGGGASKSESPATQPAASEAAEASANGEFGVKVCDDYMAKYTACVSSKVPEARASADEPGARADEDPVEGSRGDRRRPAGSHRGLHARPSRSPSPRRRSMAATGDRAPAVHHCQP